MTCQDCIHISSKQAGKADNFPLYKCNKTSFFVKKIATPCKFFMYNDGSYHDGHWHCHRCGKIVEVVGLCCECEMDLYGMRHFTLEEQEIKRKLLCKDFEEKGKINNENS